MADLTIKAMEQLAERVAKVARAAFDAKTATLQTRLAQAEADIATLKAQIGTSITEPK